MRPGSACARRTSKPTPAQERGQLPLRRPACAGGSCRHASGLPSCPASLRSRPDHPPHRVPCSKPGTCRSIPWPLAVSWVPVKSRNLPRTGTGCQSAHPPHSHLPGPGCPHPRTLSFDLPLRKHCGFGAATDQGDKDEQDRPTASAWGAHGTISSSDQDSCLTYIES